MKRHNVAILALLLGGCVPCGAGPDPLEQVQELLAAPTGPHLVIMRLQDKLNLLRVGNLLGEVDFEYVYAARVGARDVVLLERPPRLTRSDSVAGVQPATSVPELAPRLRVEDLPADLREGSAADVKRELAVPAILSDAEILAPMLGVRPFTQYLRDPDVLTDPAHLSMAERRILVSKLRMAQLGWPAGAMLFLEELESREGSDAASITVQWAFRRPLTTAFSEPVLSGTVELALSRSGDEWLVTNVEDLIDDVYDGLAAQ